MTRSVIITYYSKYGKLLKGPEDKPILDNDEIAGDVGDAGMAGDIGNGRDTGNAGEVRHIGDVEEAGYAGDVKNVGDVGDARNNDVTRRNNGVGDDADQDNRRATIKDAVDRVTDVVDVVDRVTDVVDPIGGVLAEVLTHSFGLLSPGSNPPPGIPAARTG